MGDFYGNNVLIYSKVHGFMKKITYEAPAILREVDLQVEGEILTGSVVDTTTVVSTGQEVEEYDFSQSDFNHDWKD